MCRKWYLSGLAFIPLFKHQVKRLEEAFSRLRVILVGSGWQGKGVLSSVISVSQRNILNKSGPNKEPRGTPVSISCHEL